jgi:hypothetical protein
MCNGRDLELEGNIHSLICGELDEPARDEVLLRIARDDGARALLREMLELQRAARRAFGYDRADRLLPKLADATVAMLANHRSECTTH